MASTGVCSKLDYITSSTFILNTGVPQGCVLRPLLYSLVTNDCFPVHSSNTIIKFSDDTTVVVVTHFLFVGGERGLNKFYLELAVLLLVVYLMVLIGNLIIFTLVVTDPKLHTAMYIFLSNLSLIDIGITTSVLPKMISVCLWNDVTISYSACFFQMYVYLSFQTVEVLLLCFMAYDRYVAICNPLLYSSIITKRVCALLATAAWVVGLCLPAFSVIYASQMPYCSNKIHFWFCDHPPVVSLSCWDTTILIDVGIICAFIAIYLPLTVIVWSYYRIIVAVCKIVSSEGRMKAFSTCSSHLIIVLTFYFIHSCIYISAKYERVHCNVLILISIVNSFLTPVMNPILYSLRNEEIKAALRKLCSGKVGSYGE
ncbi:olfactory receptor 2AT4-like [Esox lucius]|uniref:olfactory receptor 2AT4-like n=1 Tax=Esox lucius TaxID=8010 RepID=UPI001476CD2A|nr:olfactory receptor 2AT4-like [Esox lucius]